MPRLEQLSALSSTVINGAPVLIHGSIGHAALMGLPLPAEAHFNGLPRDIDIFMVGQTKTSLEEEAETTGLTSPQPLDAGLCSLLVTDGDEVFIQKDGLTMPVEDCGVFDEVANFELVETGGIEIRSFSPTGMLAVHSIEPRVIRPTHIKVDWELARWFKENDVVLPDKLQASIDEFHKAYREKYPLGNFYRQLADVYTSILPETVRSRLRQHTHRFMRDHAGRVSPYVD